MFPSIQILTESKRFHSSVNNMRGITTEFVMSFGECVFVFGVHFIFRPMSVRESPIYGERDEALFYGSLVWG